MSLVFVFRHAQVRWIVEGKAQIVPLSCSLLEDFFSRCVLAQGV